MVVCHVYEDDHQVHNWIICILCSDCIDCIEMLLVLYFVILCNGLIILLIV